MNFTIFTASHKEDVLQNNLMKSEFIKMLESKLIIVRDKTNVSLAIGEAIEIIEAIGSIDDAYMIVHNDVFLPENFVHAFTNAFQNIPNDWGIIGVAGVRPENGRRKNIGHIKDRGREWGSPISKFERVQTLDELLIIINPKANLVFDPQFEQDFYAADLCMQAKDTGYGVYVFPGGYVHHNSTRPIGGRTESFYESEKKFREKWSWVDGPIMTTCSIIK